MYSMTYVLICLMLLISTVLILIFILQFFFYKTFRYQRKKISFYSFGKQIIFNTFTAINFLQIKRIYAVFNVKNAARSILYFYKKL